ncbi:MAG: DMT family transporter [Pseudomonadota bacterium]
MFAQWFANPLTRLFVGAVIISFSPVWVELVDIPPTSSGFYRVAIGGVVLTIYLYATGQRFGLSKRVYGILVLTAIAFAADLWFWHRSINYVGPGMATLLVNFQVFFMMLAGALWLNQRPTARQLFAVPMALIGLGMIVGFDWASLSSDYRLGVLLGLATAVAYTCYLLSMRAARMQAKHALPIREVALMSLGAAILLAGAAAVEGESLVIPTGIDSFWMLNYGIVSHGLGLMLVASSLQKVAPTQVGIALLLQPALSVVWDVVFFGRTLTPIEIAGAVLALLAIYFGGRSSTRSVQQSSTG